MIRGDWALEEKGLPAALALFSAAESLLPAGSPLIIERLEEVLQQHKPGPELHKKLAQLCEAGGDLAGAVRHLEAFLSAVPGDGAASGDLSRILRSEMNTAFGAGELEKAAEFGNRLLKAFPDDASLTAHVGQITQMLNIQKKEKLEGLLATGRMPKRHAAQAHYDLAGIERAQDGDEEVILSHLQKAAVEHSPVRAQALRELGALQAEKGACDTADGVYEILFSLRLEAEARLEWGYEIAEAFEAKGEQALAQKYFEMVASEDVNFKNAAERAGALAKAMESAGQAPAAAVAPAEAASSDPMTVLSRCYDDIKELGRGAMGVVYKARDKILDCPVAIKMILGDLGEDSEALERFITEAQSAAALEHPGIITIYDIRTEEPMFIVMEFVEGKDLGDVLGGKICPLPLFKKLAVRFCEPLALAHQAEVIHRDIKPDNIMVTKNGGVKIADFGLSRKGGGSGMTQVGQVMGTPYYMALEQIRGEEVDGRSDLYALGITFYEMLTGTVPFKKGDIAYMHMHEEPPGIAARNPEVPPELEEIVMKCLRKDPAERYQTVDDLLAALQTVG